jgi:prefoldin subunit 5
MAKICINQKCKKEIPSSATYCLFCGAQQTENEQLSEEERLRKELRESSKTIELLKKSLAEAHEKIDKGISDETMLSLNEKLAEASGNQKKLENQMAEKNKKIEQLKIESKKKKSRGTWIIFLIISIGLGIATIYFYNEYNSQSKKINEIENQNNSLENELRELKSEQQNVKDENKTLQQKLNEISDYCPIIITSLKIGNIDKNGRIIETPHGKTLYGSNYNHLEPLIEYIGLKENTTIILYVKLYRYGTLKNNYKEKFSVSDGGTVKLPDFVCEYGDYASGSYRCEIWYNNICIKYTDFDLLSKNERYYTPPPPIGIPIIPYEGYSL